MGEFLKGVPGVLRAVTDPFSLLALIVLVLGWVAQSTLRSIQAKAAQKNPTLTFIPLSIVAVAILALAFNVIRVTSLQHPTGSNSTSTRYLVQATFKGVIKHKQAVTVPFSTTSGQLNVGCGDSATTNISWNVPAGSREINAYASWERTDNLKGANQQTPPVNGMVVTATGTITGQDRQWTGNCPGGGHGELVLSGSYVVDQDAPDTPVVVGTFQNTVPEGGQASFPIPAEQGTVLQQCELRVTSTSTNLVGSLTLDLRADEAGGVTISSPPVLDSKIHADISDKKLVVTVP
jgi:hypothetical protein